MIVEEMETKIEKLEEENAKLKTQNKELLSIIEIFLTEKVSSVAIGVKGEK